MPRVRAILLGLLFALPAVSAHGDYAAGAHPGVADVPVMRGDAAAALDAARAAGLFFAFERTGDQFSGHFVSFGLDGGAVTDLSLGGTVLATRIDAGVAADVHELPPVAAIGDGDAAISVHDNRHAWTSVRGEIDSVSVTLPTAPQVSGGRVFADVDGLRVHVILPLGGRLDVAGNVVTATFDHGWAELVLATSQGPFAGEPEGFAWILAARDGADAALDVLSVDGAPLGLEAAEDGLLAVDVVVLVGSPDQVVRVESAGFFDAAPLAELSAHRGSQGFYNRVDQDAIYAGGKGRGGVHMEREGTGAAGAVTIADVRLPLRPGGLVDGGVVWLEWDREAPEVTAHAFEAEPVPRVHVETSEATAAIWWTGASADALEPAEYDGESAAAHDFALPVDAGRDIWYRIELRDAVGRMVIVEDRATPPATAGEDSPGPGLAWATVAMVLVAAVLRRR